MKLARWPLITAFIVLSGCGGKSDSGSPASTEPMKPSATGEMMASADTQDFFPKAASAGMLEIEASKLALAQSQDAGVKSFAQMMIDDHTKAADELKALAVTKAVTLPASMSKGDQSDFDSLKDEKPGEDFTKAYKKLMVASHKDAVTLFDKQAKDGTDADLRSWAAKTLPTLQHHGSMAEALPPA